LYICGVETIKIDKIQIKFMETTFDKFITNNAKQKALFDKEYAEFSRSECALENLDKKQQIEPAVVKSKARYKRYATEAN